MQTRFNDTSAGSRTKWSCPQCRMDCPIRFDPNPQFCPTCRFLERGETPSASHEESQYSHAATSGHKKSGVVFRLFVGAFIAVMTPAILLTIVAMLSRHDGSNSKPAYSLRSTVKAHD